MRPATSLPASGVHSLPGRSAYDPAVTPTPRQEAIAAEQRSGYLAAGVGLALQLLLLGLTVAASVADRADPPTWQLSCVLLTLLLFSATMVALLLAIEPDASALLRQGESLAANVLVGSYRAVIVAPLLVALAVAGWVICFDNDVRLGWRGCWVLILILVVTSGLIAAVTAAAYWPHGQKRDLELDEHQRTVDPTRAWGPPADRLKVTAVGASGGGIRAASFVLGGHQALQTAAPKLGIAAPEDEPRVFAVSGGSYVAAALALRRAFDAETGAPLPELAPWTVAYAADSVELERLRRHTRYLFEPRGRTLDGVFTLITGAMVNLFVAGVALLLLAWVSAQVALSLGVLGLRAEGGRLLDFWVSVEDHPWSVLAVPGVLSLAVAFLTAAGWFQGAKFDNAAGRTVRSSSEAERRVRTGRWVRWSATWRAPLTGLALGWLLLAVGIPAATTGVAELATRNQPTATLARGLAAIGLATQDMCSHAFGQSLEDAVDQVVVAAEANPGVERKSTAGACGAEVTLSWTAGTDAQPQPQIPADTTKLERFANLDDGKPIGRVGAIIGLLLSVLGLLRRGPQPGEATAGTKGMAALRRRLLTILPLTLTALIGVYVLLVAFRWLVSGSEAGIVISAALAVAACTIAFLLDANGTSMHSFYRSRLADAFAVGVRTVGGRQVAQQLPPDPVYRYSDLRGPTVAKLEDAIRDAHNQVQQARETPDQVAPTGFQKLEQKHERKLKVRDRVVPNLPGGRLHIVATLNSQRANETPTMRGGFPLVFGPAEVGLFREGALRVAVPVRDYENYAGPRRVSIMASVAISGAAVSPLMGRYAEQMAPYRFLLALFNIRLGTWVRNPAHTPRDAELGADKRSPLWLTSKPGLAQMVLEGVGSSSANRRWVYLSDGGHLDNTGMVEAVRSCAVAAERGRVLVLDASNDPADSWQAVGDAVAVIRADLCLDLHQVSDDAHPPWMRLYVANDDTGRSLVEVLVVKAVRVPGPSAEEAEPGAVTKLIRKAKVVEHHAPPASDWWAGLPPDVQSFQAKHPDFPRASTGRQKFGDLEFEAYRALGYATTTEAFRAVGWID